VKSLLIVYHSMTGGAQQMAQAAAHGAAAIDEVHVQLARAQEVGGQEVLAADGYVFATPENLAAVSGLMKDFFDRTYYAVLDRIVGRPYALLICAGSDGSNAVRQVERITTGWRLRKVCDPVIVCTHAQAPEEILAPKVIAAEDLQRCEEAGMTLAAGLAAGIY
jgi:multimeric flavodoxin WrbA